MDIWIRHYRPNPNSVNSTISYYTKGAVIGFVLDSYLRRESRGRNNLDEVMREMYRRYASEPYPPGAFAALVEEVGGADAAELLDRLLYETADPDVDDALDWYGLMVERDVNGNGNSAEPLSGFGILWEEGIPGMVVKTVRSDGGGALAGLVPGDEVLAIGGERLRPDNFDAVMKSFRPGEQTTLLVSRRGKISSLDLTPDTLFKRLVAHPRECSRLHQIQIDLLRHRAIGPKQDLGAVNHDRLTGIAPSRASDSWPLMRVLHEALGWGVCQHVDNLVENDICVLEAQGARQAVRRPRQNGCHRRPTVAVGLCRETVPTAPLLEAATRFRQRRPSSQPQPPSSNLCQSA